MNVSFLQELLGSIAEQGRSLLPRALGGGAEESDIVALSEALVSSAGEASGVVVARRILDNYHALDSEGRKTFFRYLAERMQPDPEQVAREAKSYLEAPSSATLTRLQAAVDSPRQEFFRRLNLAAGATREIVEMRKDILRRLPSEPGLASVDNDLRHLLYSWFNRGFLVLRRIDWQTPAAILEKIIAYEAVHAIDGWDDLRRRLDPADRRCFAFFHPALIDEPLIFVEVALMGEIPGSIQSVLSEAPKTAAEVAAPSTAVFYSISNCQEGLRGISFGNFLIKQVVEELVRELPSLKTFVTLSPVPTFARWLDRLVANDEESLLSEADVTTLRQLRDPRWLETVDESDTLEETVMALAAHYFCRAKSKDNRPVDPVARFHLGNGARLERINWLGDVSEKGLREAHGLMVNYRYDLKEIERNHEIYANEGTVVTSRAVRSLLRAQPKTVAREPSAAIVKPSPAALPES